MPETSLAPIIVIVRKGRYDCYGLRKLPTERDLELSKILQEMGGVNESVPEGRYYFNVELIEGEVALATLYPAE